MALPGKDLGLSLLKGVSCSKFDDASVSCCRLYFHSFKINQQYVQVNLRSSDE